MLATARNSGLGNTSAAQAWLRASQRHRCPAPVADARRGCVSTMTGLRASKYASLLMLVAAVSGWAPVAHRSGRPHPTRPTTRLAAKPQEPAAASPLAAPKDDRAVWVEPKDWVPGDFESDEAVPFVCVGWSFDTRKSSHDVSVPANDAGLSKLFDDLLRTGLRRVITTWGVRAENRTCLARYGCQMELQKVEDVREESQGRLQWRCRHQLSSSRVRIDKVVARSAGDASYLRCVAPNRLMSSPTRVK